MTKILEPWRWPIAVVLSVALASLAALFLVGPQMGVDPQVLTDLKRWVSGGAAALGALLLPALKAWLTADSDGDGKPDWMDKTPTGPRDALVALLVAGSVVLGAGLLQACGTAAQQHRSLNALTTVADPTYEEVVQLCDRMRNRIVERSGTTREQDREDMDEVNEPCDVAVLKFEGIRGSQLTARAFIDSGAEGAARAAVQEALALWPAIQRLAERLFASGGGR